MARVYLGLGTNLGDRLANLENAHKALNQFSTIEACSSVYETSAWGYTNQPAFLNQVIEIDTKLSPHQLLYKIKRAEKDIGRVKSFRWGPRLIDIDILFYDQRVVRLPWLTIPHKNLQNRAFVLVPLAEIAPDLVHPVFKKSVRGILDLLPEPYGVEKCNFC